MVNRITRSASPWTRRLVWSALLLLGLGGGSAYYYLHPNELPEWASRTRFGRDLQTTRVYKWRDDTGAWHITDHPPPPDTQYETERYSRDTNVLPLPPKLQR